MLKNSKVVYFCHLKKLVGPETFGPYYVPCNLFNTRILALYLKVSNIIIITTLSFDDHLPEEDHSRSKHVGLPYIYKLFYLYWCAVVGINIVN